MSSPPLALSSWCTEHWQPSTSFPCAEFMPQVHWPCVSHLFADSPTSCGSHGIHRPGSCWGFAHLAKDTGWIPWRQPGLCWD
jgi:hypothetical protein